MANDTISKAAQRIIDSLDAGQKARITANGHTAQLYVRSLTSSCGAVMDGTGVAFEFNNEGGWVVSLADLKAIVEAAEHHQATRPLASFGSDGEVGQ